MKHRISHTRSSLPEVFCEKYVLNNFLLFTGEHLCWSPCFSKWFSCEYCEKFKNTFVEEYLETNVPEYTLEHGVLVKSLSLSLSLSLSVSVSVSNQIEYYTSKAFFNLIGLNHRLE